MANVFLSLIVAVTENNVIGRDNEMPWHLPEDLKYFKAVTLGKPIIMGRKTFSSLGKPLPGRPNIVVTRQPDSIAEQDSLYVVSDLAKAVEKATTLAQGVNAPEAVIIGGAEIYTQSLALVKRIYLTRIHAHIDGDAYFPSLDAEVWREVSVRQHTEELAKGDLSYTFFVLERKQS